MAQLLDQWGNPIDLKRLRREEAGPTVAGVRQIISGHPAQGLTPDRLTRLLLEAEQGDPTAYLELAEEMEEKDWHYLSVLGTRKRAVAQLGIRVEAGGDSARDEEIAGFVRDWLAREELEDELIDILDAIGKGYSATEIIWDLSARQWRPQRLVWRDPRWFEFDRETGHRLMLRGDSGPEPLAPFKYIVHTAKTKSGLPIRGGLARAAGWAYLFKNYDVKDWVTFLEVFGQPMRVGKYHSGASEEDKEILLRAVTSIGSDAAAIMPDSMRIEFVEGKLQGNGSEVYERFADWIDRQVSKAVLGQTLTTEVSGGSLAAARVHDGVRRDIMRSDARQAGAVLNRDLVRPMVDLNFGPQQHYPRIELMIPDSVELESFADAVGALVDRGLRVGQAEVRGKLGLSDPLEQDEILVPSGRLADHSPDGAQTATQIARAGAAADSIDDLVAGMADDWELVIDPMVERIRDLVDDAASLEEVRDGLARLIGDMPTDEFRELLARAGFAARLAGEVEADLGPV